MPETENLSGLEHLPPVQCREVKENIASHPCHESENSVAIGPKPEMQELFSCNICLEVASDPVVTMCGHLYCWPCLYKWLQTRYQCRTCPVCKAGVDRDKVVPIYGPGSDKDPRLKTKAIDDLQVLPPRPAGQRPVPVVHGAFIPSPDQLPVGGQQGFGLIPTLLGLQGTGQGGYPTPLTPEQQHQAFLSRLLLMLGSFIIMCCKSLYRCLIREYTF